MTSQIESLLQEKLNLSPEVSEQAVSIVLGFVKERLPDNLQGIVDQAASGEANIAEKLPDDLKDKLGGLGNLFG